MPLSMIQKAESTREDEMPTGEEHMHTNPDIVITGTSDLSLELA